MNPSLERARVRMAGVAAVMIVIDVLAVVFLLSPVGQSYEAWQKRRAEAQTKLQEQRREAAPLLNIEKRIAQSRSEASEFMNTRFVHRDSDISAQLQELAKDEKVKIEKIAYKDDPSDLEHVDVMSIDTAVTGDYGNLIQFINAVERSKTAYVLKSVALDHSETGVVRLQLQMQTYLNRNRA